MSYFKKRETKLTVLILVVFGFGFYLGQTQVVCEVCPPQDLDFSLFWEAYHKLQDKFVDKEKFDTDEMIYGAIAGMAGSLGDPYTVFLSPEDTKKFTDDVDGVFEGVGMEIDIRKGQLMVVAPIEGTPAQRAGLQAGDKIMKVDDTSTIDLTIDEAVSLIRGPRGTEVVLTVYREDWEEIKEIGIIRAVIEIPSLKLEFKEDDVAYLRLYQFSGIAAFDFRQAVFEILDSPARKIILDLRNNPGGYLEVSQDIAGWFLERGEIVVVEDFGNGEEREYKSEGTGSFSDYDIVVLINQGSASASEILAGALRDNLGVLLVGEKSFGKGSVQQLEKLRGGSSLKITVAKWLTPNGHLITDIGLEPDIEVEMTQEDYNENRDPQLNKAIEIIKNL